MRIVPALAIVTACGHGAAGTGDDDPMVDAPPADGAPIDAPAHVAPRGMFALLNKAQLGTTYARVQTTLLCRGPGDPIASCTARGAGFDTNAGVTMQVQWNDLQPTGPDSLDTTMIESLVHDWRAAGKLVNIVIQPAPYFGATSFVPDWYVAAGNPTYSTPCSSAVMPVEWGPEFQAAWKHLIDLVRAQLDDGSLGYIRFGLGIGGENSPSQNLSPGCKTQLHDLGFTTDTTWPAPDSQAWQDEVAATWVDYQKAMIAYEASKQFHTQLSFSLSPIAYAPTIDKTTPDRTAAAAVAAGLAIGNQGWRASDQATANGGGTCSGDWCALFAQYAGQVPLELQPTMRSDPAGGPPTGSLMPMLSFALARHAQILELYSDDWLCTYDTTAADFQACTTAGYPAAFATAASALE
jgi:hypothetical protein